MIENIVELIKSRRSNKTKPITIDLITNDSHSIESAKARVQKIIDSGALKRRKIKKRRKKDKEDKS